MHASLAPWIRNGQVLIRDIKRSGIAIHAPNAPHMRHPCAIDTQLVRNTCEIVAPERFHQTISAMLLRICTFFRTPYERGGVAGQWRVCVCVCGGVSVHFFVRRMSAVASPASGGCVCVCVCVCVCGRGGGGGRHWAGVGGLNPGSMGPDPPDLPHNHVLL